AESNARKACSRCCSVRNHFLSRTHSSGYSNGRKISCTCTNTPGGRLLWQLVIALEELVLCARFQTIPHLSPPRSDFQGVQNNRPLRQQSDLSRLQPRLRKNCFLGSGKEGRLRGMR